MFALFFSSGLFLGWSLGANDASNVFGTAVGTRMIRFRTAALCCSIFVILGAVISGAGASHTLGRLGTVNAIAGAFIVALAAAASIYLMTRARYPVSTSQAIVGAIIGWNLFSGSLTDTRALTKIVLTWVACPVLSAVIAVVIYQLVAFLIRTCKFHMFRLDSHTRWGLLLAGAFGSYSLGANNIANVMGVFVPVSPFSDISCFGLFTLSSAQQLFFIGGVAIAVGVYTYSQRVMLTVGEGIMELTPVAALVVVWAHSIVLFLFASQSLEGFLSARGLPTIPLVPVSSSQAIVGAVIGVGLLKGGRGIRWRTIGGIASGWVVTPIISAVMSLVALFFLQNVFQQETYRPVAYHATAAVWERLQTAGLPRHKAALLPGHKFSTAVRMHRTLSEHSRWTSSEIELIMAFAEIHLMQIAPVSIRKIKTGWISPEQIKALEQLQGQTFDHKWQLKDALTRISHLWRYKENDNAHNLDLTDKLHHLYRLFQQ